MQENEKNFETAAEATRNMFEETPETGAVPEEQSTEQMQEQPGNEEQALEMAGQATQAAEAMAEAAQQKNQDLQQVLERMELLTEQNRQLQETVNQMSQQQEESLVEEMTEEPELPVLDMEALAFASPEEVQASQLEYAKKMREYVEAPLLKKLSPFMEQAQAGLRQKEKDEFLSVAKEFPQLNGIENVIPDLERIIQQNPILANSDAPLDEKYMTAYTILKGAESINTPKTDPTTEELMSFYEQNTDFRDAVEKKRISELQNSQQVPPMSASSGAVNAALNIKEKPTTFEEASERTRKMFGS